MKKRHIQSKEPSADELAAMAIFENPVASVMDYTGFVPRIPDSREEAESYSDICTNAPVTALDGGEASKKAR